MSLEQYHVRTSQLDKTSQHVNCVLHSQESHQSLLLPLVILCRNPPYRPDFQNKWNFSLSVWSSVKDDEAMSEALQNPGIEKLWSEATLSWDEINFTGGYYQVRNINRTHN